MSLEHYLSQSVTKNFKDDGDASIVGVPWAMEQPMVLPLQAMQARILCRHHNSDLSELDDAAGRFVGKIKQAHLALSEHSGRSATNTFVGDKLERWFLKVIFGGISAGIFEGHGLPTGRVPPQILGQILLEPVWKRASTACVMVSDADGCGQQHTGSDWQRSRNEPEDIPVT